MRYLDPTGHSDEEFIGVVDYEQEDYDAAFDDWEFRPEKYYDEWEERNKKEGEEISGLPVAPPVAPPNQIPPAPFEFPYPYNQPAPAPKPPPIFSLSAGALGGLCIILLFTLKGSAMPGGPGGPALPSNTNTETEPDVEDIDETKTPTNEPTINSTSTPAPTGVPPEEARPNKDKTYVDKDGNEYKFKPKRNWDGKPDRNGNYVDKYGRAWSKPTTHGSGHGVPHRDIQLLNGRHVTVIPK